MKKTMKKKGGGELLSMLSPAYALHKSLKSGKAEGILGMGAVGAAYNKSRKGGGAAGSADNPASNMAAKTKAMKKGGKVGRGDGCCMKGKTKGTMR